MLPGVERHDQLEPRRVAHDAVDGQSVAGLERLDRVLGRDPEDGVGRDGDAVGAKQALDRADVRAAVAEALVREMGLGERADIGRRPSQQQGGEGEWGESADGARHGA